MRHLVLALLVITPIIRSILCELWEISHDSLFKEPLGQLLLHKHSSCSLSYHKISPFQKQCHTYFLTEFFLCLICRLGTRVSSIFQTLSQKLIFNPVKHLRWSFFAKIVNSLKALSIFAKSSIVDVRPGCKYASVRSH